MSNQPWGPDRPDFRADGDQPARDPYQGQQDPCPPQPDWGSQQSAWPPPSGGPGPNAYGPQNQHLPPGQPDPYPPNPYRPNPYDQYTAVTGPVAGRPRPSVGLLTAVRLFFKNYAVFTGRASRSEYWWVALFNSLVAIGWLVALLVSGGATMMSEGMTTADPDAYVSSQMSASLGIVPALVSVVCGIYFLVTIIPFLAITWRRFHDTDKSGAMYFLTFIPYVGGPVVLVLLAMPSSPLAWQRWDNGRLPAES